MTAKRTSKNIGIVLAAGSGTRMKTTTKKQYLMLAGEPLVCYSLNAMNQSDLIDEIILVVAKGDVKRCQEEYIKPYGFHKVRAIVEGGSTRYFSVREALRTIEHDEGYLFIHDGARPFLETDLIDTLYHEVVEYGAVTAAVPAQDTIKIADVNGLSLETPNRNSLWMIQTPQVFATSLLQKAYGKLETFLKQTNAETFEITDDAMIVERLMGKAVKMVHASYRNMKITTPEDLFIAETLLQQSTMNQSYRNDSV
ncbi:MAG: 2-C-methyl-D-erythritol 4-phosphate cytidylyltransferase [Lachnospiraceae bacterium]|nr:2-C-methyl-D-erythritol 4-phosphate cytidylyltransferase [Lachnospiraceae bacterium]